MRIRAEEEARRVLEEAEATAEARAAARNKAREEDEMLVAAARKSAQARAEAVAAEEARIAAIGKDEWFYTRGGQQIGPVGLAELRNMVSDPTFEPPVKSVFTEGMDGWRPVYEVGRVFEPVASDDSIAERDAENSSKPDSKDEGAIDMAAEVIEAKALEESNLQAAIEAKVAEEKMLRKAAEAKAAEESRLRDIAEAQALEESRAAAAKAKAIEEAKIRAEEEANRRALAEARAAEETKRREAAEAKAVEEARLRAIAEAKALEENRIAAVAKTKAIEEAKIRAEEDANRRALAEAKAAEETKRREAAETKAVEEARLRAIAEAKALEENRIAAAAKAKAMEQAKVRAEQEAKLRALSEAKAAEEASAIDEIEALALEEERIATLARKKADQEAAAKAEFKERAAEANRLKAVTKAARANIRKAARDQLRKLRTLEKTLRNTENVTAERPEEIGLLENKDRDNATIAAAKASKDKTGTSRIAHKSIWFYTCEGERRGPVSFEELRTMAEDSSLDPRLDMVWKDGMETWKPAGRIDGLFERRSMPAETKATTASSIEPLHSTSFPKKTCCKGLYWPGTRRLKLLLVTLVFPFAWQFAIAAISPLLFKQFGTILMGKLLPYTAIVPFAVVVYFGLRRLTNLGMSRWWYLAVFAPVLNLWLGYRCFACPPGYADHKKMDRSGFALAFLYWLILIWGLSILPTTTTPLYCTIDSEKLPAQLRTALHGANLPVNWRH